MTDQHDNIDWVAVLAKAAKAADPAARPLTKIINPMAEALPGVFTTFEINTPQRQAHFISQCCVESDYFHVLEEYASGKAYEGRKDLGNVHPGDGVKFKGRGPIQVTGYDNYLYVQKRLTELGYDVDIMSKPELLEEPLWGLLASAIWWERNRGNSVADRDTTGRLTSRLVNRGNSKSDKPARHEAKRMAAFKAVLKVVSAAHEADDDDDAPAQDASAALTKFEIEAIQKQFRALGYFMVGKIDGKWGPATKAAVTALQEQVRLGRPEIHEEDGTVLPAKPADPTVVADGCWSEATKLLLADPANRRWISEERANTTIEDIRAQGSKTIAAADKVQEKAATITDIGRAGQALSTVVVAVGGAYSYFDTAKAYLTPIMGFFTGIPLWAWGVAAFVVAYFLWSRGKEAQQGAEEVKIARRDAERKGLHNGEPDPAPSPPVESSPAGDLKLRDER